MTLFFSSTVYFDCGNEYFVLRQYLCNGNDDCGNRADESTEPPVNCEGAVHWTKQDIFGSPEAVATS